MEAASARALRPSSPPGAALNRLRSDHRLAERFAAGDEGAFAVLYERHRRRLLAICIGVLGSYEDAQDALQNALAAATASLRERTPEDVRAWLAKVARNAAIDAARARRVTDPLGGDEPAREAGPDGQAEERAELESLVVSLRLLPEQQRMAVVMRELGGSSYGEIASALEVEETAVRGLIARARMSLRAELEASELACATVREELAHQPDGRRRPAVVRRHLRGCDGCRDFSHGIRSDARALRGLAPAAGGISLIGLASLLRLTRPVAVGGALAKGAFGTGAIQAVVACAVCLTAAEGVREIVVEPAGRGPRAARPAQSPADASAATAAATSGAGTRASGDGTSLSATAEHRQAAARRRAAARERLRSGGGPLPLDDNFGADFGDDLGRPGGFGDRRERGRGREREGGFDGAAGNGGRGGQGDFSEGRGPEGRRDGGGGGGEGNRPPRERHSESFAPPANPDVGAPAPAVEPTAPLEPVAPAGDGAADGGATP